MKKSGMYFATVIYLLIADTSLFVWFFLKILALTYSPRPYDHGRMKNFLSNRLLEYI